MKSLKIAKCLGPSWRYPPHLPTTIQWPCSCYRIRCSNGCIPLPFSSASQEHGSEAELDPHKSVPRHRGRTTRSSGGGKQTTKPAGQPSKECARNKTIWAHSPHSPHQKEACRSARRWRRHGTRGGTARAFASTGSGQRLLWYGQGQHLTSTTSLIS